MKLLTLFLSTLLFASIGLAQSPKASPTPSPSEPALLSLTDEERAIDIKVSLLTQPDFVADESFFYWEGFGGMSDGGKVGQLGDRRYRDNFYFVFLETSGKAYRLNRKTKTYDEMPIPKETKLLPGGPLNVQALASREGVEYVPLGAQLLETHRCIKVEAKVMGETAQVFLYLAPDLKNLVVASQVILGKRSSTTRLRNISLTVSKDLFEIPANYKPLSPARKSTSEKPKPKH